MSRSSSVSLLDIQPELADVLVEEQRIEAQRFLLPVVAADKGGDVVRLLEESGPFGAIVLDGMLIEALLIGEDPTLRLIGPGSFVPAAEPCRRCRFSARGCSRRSRPSWCCSVISC